LVSWAYPEGIVLRADTPVNRLGAEVGVTFSPMSIRHDGAKAKRRTWSSVFALSVERSTIEGCKSPDGELVFA
jgi:hypothetical protein